MRTPKCRLCGQEHYGLCYAVTDIPPVTDKVVTDKRGRMKAWRERNKERARAYDRAYKKRRRQAPGG